MKIKMQKLIKPSNHIKPFSRISAYTMLTTSNMGCQSLVTLEKEYIDEPQVVGIEAISTFIG